MNAKKNVSEARPSDCDSEFIVFAPTGGRKRGRIISPDIERGRREDR